jgi:hemin uptake protein HemP
MNAPPFDPPKTALNSAGGTQPGPAAGASRQRRISSAELFAGGREILIEHSGETYRLRHTSLGKLILTK